MTYLAKKTLKGLLYGSIAGAALSVIIYLTMLKDPNKDYLLVFIMFWVAPIYLVIYNIKGVLMHRYALKKYPLSEIKKAHNLEIEKINNYYGLSGQIDKWFIKLYYNWSSSLLPRYISRDICIMFYYQKPLNSEGKLDFRLLNKLNEKYSLGLFKINSYRISFAANYLAIEKAYTIATNEYDIKEYINKACEILETEGFEPIDRETVENLISKNRHQVGPSIETYQKNN